MERTGCIMITTLLAAAGVPAVTGTIFPYWPYNPHLQHYISTQLDFHHPRNLYELRTLYQDDTTRCQLRLWRISRQGALSCEDDDECHYGTVCRVIKVCKLTEGKLCWSKEPVHGFCTEDKDCESNNCHEKEKTCGYPLLYDPNDGDDKDADDKDKDQKEESSDADTNSDDQYSNQPVESDSGNSDEESSYTSVESDPNARSDYRYFAPRDVIPGSWN